MNYKLLFVLLQMLISIAAWSQADFRPGYIINNNGDTISGEINYPHENRLNLICRFKDNQQNVTEYLPFEIQSYRFTNGRYFISMYIDGNPVFIEYLLKGKLNLYSMNTTGQIRYFIDKEGEEFVELPYDERVVKILNKKRLYKSTQHIGFLTYHMREVPDLRPQINRISQPNHRNMIKIAQAYHNEVCEEGQQCIVYNSRVPKVRITLELMAGLLEPTYGVTARFWLPHTSDKFYVRLGYMQLEDTISRNFVYFKKSSKSYYPFQIGYIAPQSFRLRPMASIGLLSPDYSLGLAVRINDRINIGIQGMAIYESGKFRWVPNRIQAFSLLGGLLFTLN